MARLVGSILTEDHNCRTEIAAVLRTGSTPVSLGGDPFSRDGSQADLVIVDARDDVGRAMAAVERLRAASAAVAIFVVAVVTFRRKSPNAAMRVPMTASPIMSSTSVCPALFKGR